MHIYHLEQNIYAFKNTNLLQIPFKCSHEYPQFLTLNNNP